MDCREFLLRYSEYDDSLIGPHEVGRFRAHMASCPSCARYDRVLRKGRMLARQAPTPEPSPDFMPRLQRRLLASRTRRPSPRGARMAAGLAAATVLMVTAAAVDLMGSDPLRFAGTSATGAVETASSGAVGGPGGKVAGKAGSRGALGLATALDLPAAKSVGPGVWVTGTVVREPAASYSPLVTGPPAYRAGTPPSYPGYDTERRALD